VSPVGDTAADFAALAAERGLDLQPGRALAWLTNRGHCSPLLEDGLPAERGSALKRIFEALGGDAAALEAKSGTPLRPDFLLGEAEQLVELDESQHFTTARLRTLGHYPATTEVGFDLLEYRSLCQRLRASSDRDFAHRKATEFPGAHGRQRQRAYFDAFRDLAAPAFGHGRVIRVHAPERDPELAIERLLQRLGT
jgi:hypothetical protein